MPYVVFRYMFLNLKDPDSTNPVVLNHRHFILLVLSGIMIIENLTGLTLENKSMFAVTKNEQ